MQTIINQPLPTVTQEPVPEAPEETIGKACAGRAFSECSVNIMCGTSLGMVAGILAPVSWQGLVVNTLTGMTVGACLSHKTTHTLYKSLFKRPAIALYERGSLCPPCPRLNTASAQADETPVHYV